MVKNSKKSKNLSPTQTPPSQRQTAKLSTTTKPAKKSEKPKASSTATGTRGLPKSKVQLQQQRNFDVADPPCSSKQANNTLSNNGVLPLGRPKSPTKSPWGGIWKRAEKKSKDLSSSTLPTRHKQSRAQRKRSPVVKLSTSLRQSQSPESSPSVCGDDAEVSSLFRSGVIRYADVVRSKNVSSSASLKPPVIILPPPPQMPSQITTGGGAGAVTTPTATTTTIGGPTSALNSNVTFNDVTSIGLEYFPELGQHKSWQSSSGGSSGSVSKKTIVIDKATASITSDSSNSRNSECNEINAEDTTSNTTGSGSSSLSNKNNSSGNSSNSNNSNIGNNSDNIAPTSCPHCNLNAQWLERVIHNSAKPFRIHIPEYNFLQPDLAYPRFLMQFEDENYLKAENMALLGLKLALGGSFHRHHANCKY